MIWPLRRKRPSLKLKVLRNLRAGLWLGLALVVLATAVLESRLGRERLEQDLSVLASVLGNRSIAALIFDDPEAAARNVAAARFNRSVDYICLYAQGGVLFAEWQQPGFRCPQELAAAGAASRVEHSFSAMTLSAPVMDGESPIGRVLLRANKGYVAETLLLFLFASVLALIAVSLFVGAITRHRLQRVMLPLDDLHSTVREVAADTMTDKRAVKRSDDEVGELVDVFNRMLDSIAAENRALSASEERFRTLAAHAPIGVFQRDTELSLVYVNQCWRDITGLPGEADTAGAHLERVAEEDRRVYLRTWSELGQDQGTRRVEYCYSHPAVPEPRFLMENIAPLRDEEGAIEGYIGTLADVSELKNAQMELEKLALEDPLTGLPNRRYFYEHLKDTIPNARKLDTGLAVMMVDLDKFKRINDSMGHDAGDELLRALAERMRHTVFDQDVVARMGGDEFMILLTQLPYAQQVARAAQVARRLLDTLSRPIAIDSYVADLSASIGVAMFPADGSSARDLIKNADIALYEAKQAGRNRYHFYSAALDKVIKGNLRLERKLKSALDNELLEVYLQPQWSTRSRSLHWAEALLRWRDAEDGPISPARFIPLAEELGIVDRLGRLVLENVCFHLKEHDRYLSALGINGISVNLSPRQFYSRAMLAEIRQVIGSYGVAPEKIEFELTESMVMNDTDHAIEAMRRLRDLGCSLSLDDFGTGYSSLAYLKRFPLNSVKIDGSFVMDIPEDRNDVEIASAIIAMAHKLGMATVAEGVETQEQQDFLTGQGCEFLQGYHIAMPTDIKLLVADGRRRALALGRQQD